MKKLIVSLILSVTLIATTCISAFAATPTKDGVYQVPIQFRKTDGNSIAEQVEFLYETALLEIKGGKKYLTMASLSSIVGFQLYYYTDGSVSGSVQIAERVNNIEINGRTYPSGYKIPLKGNGQLVGIMLEIPYSTVSVSARIFIDYDNCKAVSTPETSTQASSSDSSKLELPTFSGGSSHTYEYPYALKQPTAQDNDSENEDDYAYNAEASDETASENISSENQESEISETKVMTKVQEKDSNTGIIIGGVVLAVILIGLAVMVIMSKSKNKR